MTLKKIFNEVKDKWPGYYVHIFYYNEEGNITFVTSYDACRGYIYDQLQKRFEAAALTTKFYGTRRKYMYLYFSGKFNTYTKGYKVTPKTVQMLAEITGMMGYPPPKFYQEDNAILIALNNSVFKNLYAVSLIFTLFKFAGVVDRTPDLNSFISKHGTPYTPEKVRLLLNNWNKIFPKSIRWKDIYGCGKNLHSEGFGELIDATTEFKDINQRVIEVYKEDKEKRNAGT